MRRFGVDPTENGAVPNYLRALAKETATPNGVFGVKVMLDRDVRPFFEGLRQVHGPLLDAELIRATFPDLRFVYLTRRDKVRQVASFVRAQQTGVWERYSGEAKPETPRFEFDFAALNRTVHDLAVREARWQDLFSALGVSPYTVVYEDFALGPEAAVREILDFLGLEPPPAWSLPELSLERLADEASDAWLGRYLEAGSG